MSESTYASSASQAFLRNLFPSFSVVGLYPCEALEGEFEIYRFSSPHLYQSPSNLFIFIYNKPAATRPAPARSPMTEAPVGAAPDLLVLDEAEAVLAAADPEEEASFLTEEAAEEPADLPAVDAAETLAADAATETELLALDMPAWLAMVEVWAKAKVARAKMERVNFILIVEIESGCD